MRFKGTRSNLIKTRLFYWYDCGSVWRRQFPDRIFSHQIIWSEYSFHQSHFHIFPKTLFPNGHFQTIWYLQRLLHNQFAVNINALLNRGSKYENEIEIILKKRQLFIRDSSSSDTWFVKSRNNSPTTLYPNSNYEADDFEINETGPYRTIFISRYRKIDRYT